MHVAFAIRVASPEESVGDSLVADHQQQKPTALLCHDPVAILAALPQAKAYRAALVAGDTKAAQAASRNWQYAGYRMAVFSNWRRLRGSPTGQVSSGRVIMRTHLQSPQLGTLTEKVGNFTSAASGREWTSMEAARLADHSPETTCCPVGPRFKRSSIVMPAQLFR